MRIDLGHGAYLEPDDEPRNSKWHKRIVRVARIANTRCGNYLVLECGHRAMSFGNLEHAAGVVFCAQCRDAEQSHDRTNPTHD